MWPETVEWRVPEIVHSAEIYVLEKLLRGEKVHTNDKYNSKVLKFFQWLGIPIMCEPILYKHK